MTTLSKMDFSKAVVADGSTMLLKTTPTTVSWTKLEPTNVLTLNDSSTGKFLKITEKGELEGDPANFSCMGFQGLVTLLRKYKEREYEVSKLQLEINVLKKTQQELVQDILDLATVQKETEKALSKALNLLVAKGFKPAPMPKTVPEAAFAMFHSPHASRESIIEISNVV